MAETTEQVAEQPKPFDSAAFIAARNDADKARLSGKEPAKPEVKPKEDPKPVVAEKEPETLEELAAHPTKLPRSVRRELNRLREQAAEAKGRLAAYEELRGKTVVEGAGSSGEHTGPSDPEPTRANFATDAEFNRALGRWDARQESKKLLEAKDKSAGEQSQQEEYEAHLRAMDEKATADMKLLPDWDEVAAKAAGEEAIEYVPAEHMQLLGLIGSSDVKAFVLYHFAKHQDEFKAMLDLTAKPDQQIRSFHRLEGRIEKLYTTEQPAQGSDGKTAGAGESHNRDESSPRPSKDRTHLADTSKEVGRTAVDRDVHKPKPSSEVSARGGTAAPPEPAIGSKEWMAKRNQAQYAR